jgi:G patch domain-containing protein 1
MQRADDFMDDEDRIQMNEDRRLENTDSFRSDQFAGTRDPSQSTRWDHM